MPNILIAHPGRQHSHQAALALQQEGVLGCYATGVPVAKDQLGAVWAGIVGQLSAYDEVGIPKSQTKINLIAPIVNRLFARYLPESVIKPLQYESFRLFDRWVARLVINNRFDAVIAYENSALYTFQAAKRMGAKCILDAADLHHCDQDRYYKSPLSARYKKRVDSLKDAEIALADCVFVTSGLALESYVSNIKSPKQIRAVPLGVDTDQFRPRSEGSVDKRAIPTFVFVGAATVKKGFDAILEALGVLASEGFSFRLFVVGVVGRSLMATSPHLKDRITEFGMVGHGQLATILAGSDCLLLPSLFESFGLVVPEAMACGVPVIVSDMVGAKELVEDGRNGFVIPAGSREILLDRMRWCLTNRESLKAMALAARARAVQSSWSEYRLRFMTAVQDVLSAE